MIETLAGRFAAPLPEYYSRHIIVWKDEGGEFADSVGELSLDRVRLLIMRPNNAFEIRRQIEVDYAQENILLYCPLSFEKPEDNWLLDVFLYSEEFRADYWSQLFEELKIENTRALRDYAKSVAPFFKSKERRARLKALGAEFHDEKALRDGIFSVLCGLKTADFHGVLRAVLFCDLEEDNPCLAAIAKYCGDAEFWRASEEAFGYAGAPDTKLLAYHMLATASIVSTDATLFSSLPSVSAFSIKAYAFFADWISLDRDRLLLLCRWVEDRFRIPEKLKSAAWDQLVRLPVFPCVDQALLNAPLMEFAEGRLNPEEVEGLIAARRGMPWAEEYAHYYAALRELADMRRFYTLYQQAFHHTSAGELWRAYAKDLYRMDQMYRRFYAAFDAALGDGIMPLEDALKAAALTVENLYKNWFLVELNGRWSALLAGQMDDAWWPDGTTRQQGFYGAHVAEATSGGKRAFVVISDALRYEVAKELGDRINGKLQGDATCKAMIGVFPSVTALGMAALLPHTRLTMTDSLSVLADGMSTEAGDREKVLKNRQAESLAIDYDRFRQMSRPERGELVKGAKVIYIYHNAIDAVAERDVLSACETALGELMLLMRILVGELSASTVFITADHGFLYTRAPLQEYEKAGTDGLTGETVEIKRRYALIRNARPDGSMLARNLSVFGQPDLTAVSPRECLRFKLQGGGMNYVHGGPTLQELAVPLIEYHYKKSGQKGYTPIEKVNIALLGDSRKITNNIFSLVFHQKEACTAKLRPRTVIAHFEDMTGKQVSDRARIVGDKADTENAARTTRVTFHLTSSEYDRNQDYFLVLADEDNPREAERIPFRIDIAFGLDFGF